MNKMVEMDEVGGIESRGLHMVDGTDSTVELDGIGKGVNSYRFAMVLKLRA